MKRRSFIKTSTIATTPAIIGGLPVSVMAKSALSYHVNNESDRVLVLIQLNGGNDGLSCVVPIDQYDNLATVRGNILIPENSLLKITDSVGLHPSMTGLKSVYDQGNLGIVQNVGYENQNRSHFRSMDIWHSGSAADQILETGWIGRYLDSVYPNYPESYPNASCPDPFALTIGNIISETCQGASGNFSLALSDPENISALATPVNNDLVDGCYGSRLDFLTKTIQQTNEYGEVIDYAYDQGSNISNKYDDANELGQKLKTVARLISGGLQTKIYIVSLGGFDTHADQVEDGNTVVGAHSNLLASLSDAICAFQDDINLMGLEQRVMGMTYSEFGRRIRSNFSLGTDHGDAAPLMVFGSCVNSSIIGNNPQIDPQIDQNQGVNMQYDFRSVYGSILMDWFDVEESQVKQLLFNDFEYIPVLDKNCINDTTLAVGFFSFDAIKQDEDVLLKWETSMEINTNYFELQHSTDGNNFIMIGKAKAKGNYSILNEYQFTHKFPVNGINYYRIKEVDLSGQQELSLIQQVYFEGLSNQGFKIYPNPANEYFVLEFNDSNHRGIKVELFNKLGAKVKSIELASNQTSLNINVSKLAPGIYNVLIHNGNQLMTDRITVL